MSHLFRNILRTNAICMLIKPQMPSASLRFAGNTRSLWHLTESAKQFPVCTSCRNCICMCGKRFASTNGEKALIDYLEEEISNESSALKKGDKLPTTVEGFQVKYDGANVNLTKKGSDETIEVSFNVNHSVDAMDNGEEDFGADYEQDSRGNTAEQSPALQSKPNFEINIIRGDTTLLLACSFLQDPVQEGDYPDVFGIEEVIIFKGESKDSQYAASGDMLEGYFYDLLMNMLAEKKITQELGTTISELATQYEQTLFVNLLKDTKTFFQAK